MKTILKQKFVMILLTAATIWAVNSCIKDYIPVIDSGLAIEVSSAELEGIDLINKSASTLTASVTIVDEEGNEIISDETLTLTRSGEIFKSSALSLDPGEYHLKKFKVNEDNLKSSRKRGHGYVYNYPSCKEDKQLFKVDRFSIKMLKLMIKVYESRAENGDYGCSGCCECDCECPPSGGDDDDGTCGDDDDDDGNGGTGDDDDDDDGNGGDGEVEVCMEVNPASSNNNELHIIGTLTENATIGTDNYTAGTSVLIGGVKGTDQPQSLLEIGGTGYSDFTLIDGVSITISEADDDYVVFRKQIGGTINLDGVDVGPDTWEVTNNTGDSGTFSVVLNQMGPSGVQWEICFTYEPGTLLVEEYVAP